MSDAIREVLISPYDQEAEKVQAKKEQKETSGLQDEVNIFWKGAQYWESLITRGTEQKVLNYGEVQILQNAVKYCNGVYAQLSKFQLKDVYRIVDKLRENGIE